MDDHCNLGQDNHEVNSRITQVLMLRAQEAWSELRLDWPANHLLNLFASRLCHFLTSN